MQGFAVALHLRTDILCFGFINDSGLFAGLCGRPVTFADVILFGFISDLGLFAGLCGRPAPSH
ncbi:MAG: hypothetical protein IJP18_09560 [Oscillospiraceae bacterium]|nr:hypothetical protein [Oscillospiraceae bacterium]